MLHVIPTNDEREHNVYQSCWCNPTVEYADPETGQPHEEAIVIHNAADCRELIEQAEEVKDSAGPISLAEFQSELAKINNWAQRGCTNHGCAISPPRGMGTNAICQCRPRLFAESLLQLACKLDKHGRYDKWKPNNL